VHSPTAPPTYRCLWNSPFTSQTKSFRLRIGMRLNSAQPHTPRPGHGLQEAARYTDNPLPEDGTLRWRTEIAAGRRRRTRLPLLFYALSVTFAGELVWLIVDMDALLLLFSFMVMFVCGMVVQAASD
jgi:hypothetical protein